MAKPTIKQLRDTAKALGIELDPKAKKSDIEKAIADHPPKRRISPEQKARMVAYNKARRQRLGT